MVVVRSSPGSFGPELRGGALCLRGCAAATPLCGCAAATPLCACVLVPWLVHTLQLSTAQSFNFDTCRATGRQPVAVRLLTAAACTIDKAHTHVFACSGAAAMAHRISR
ncbi:uncharacterized protein LOC100277105 [Zea mays]|uniref:Uncharacterized protein n=1 Tax=Zea mays TaxID=4577 RepID=A0A804QZP3_MAIZE|nr:uncharacterized protein LOC100277105 [Zea mays]|eukprot:NP_001144238.2 uncharacterized protein LOC100277105 [Zea mays]